MNKALSGIRVLDFTQVLAGPFCTMNLADFGAEVIKIEKPGTGDGSRIFGPFINGQSGYYTLVNRGKKGVAIDLKKGRDIIYEMVRNCDIVVENFKPGVMESWATLMSVPRRSIRRLFTVLFPALDRTAPCGICRPMIL